MDHVVKKSAKFALFVLCFLLFTTQMTVGVINAQSPLSVSAIDLYSSPPFSIKSNGETVIVVHVSSDEVPVAGAEVTFSTDPLEAGVLSPEVGFTDENGDLSVIYTPPITISHKDVSISASAAKTGFSNGGGKMEIRIQPSLDIAVASDSTTIKPGEKSKTTVGVSIFGTNYPISEAKVEITSLNGGTFSPSVGRTNEGGEFITEYIAPDRRDMISVSVEKAEFGGKTTLWMSMTISDAGIVAPILKSPVDGEIVNPKPMLKWGHVDGAKGYKVFLSDIVEVSELKDGFETTLNEYVLMGPLPEDTYYWKVRAIDASDKLGLPSEIRSFHVVSDVLSIDEVFLEKTTLPSGAEVLIQAKISQPSSQITSVTATIKKPDSDTDKVEMQFKEGLYVGLYKAPLNNGDTPMELEMNLLAKNSLGTVATLQNSEKIVVLPPLKFNLTIRSAPEGLTIIPVSGVYEYAKGSNISLSNEQSSLGKFVFNYWLVDGVKNEGTITMEDNHEAVAVFKAIEIEEEPISEVFVPVTTPPSENVVYTEKPVTTMPPTTLVPTTPPPVSSETEPTTSSFGKILLLIIFSGASIIILLKIKPVIRKKKVPGMPLDDVESIKEVAEIEAKVIEVEEPVMEEEAVEEPEEAPVVEPEVLEDESEEEPVEEEVEEIIEEPVTEEVKVEVPEKILEVEEVPEIPEEAIEVDSETLGLLKIIKDIGDAYERAALGLLFRQFLKLDPKKTMQDVRSRLDEAAALGLVKKEFLKNKDGVIEINYSLTSKGEDCLNTTS